LQIIYSLCPKCAQHTLAQLRFRCNATSWCKINDSW